MANTLTSQSLPPELWLDILSIVVHIPGFFDTKWDYQPDDLIWGGVWASIAMEDQSTKMRKTIVQVSREWQNMGRRFLFEDVVVGSLVKASALATLFEQTSNLNVLSGGDVASGAGDPPAGCGRWVKRITIEKDILFDEDVFPVLERLLRHCLQVRAVRLKGRAGDPDKSARLRPVSRLLQFRFPRCLRRIYLGDVPLEGGSWQLVDYSETPISLDWASLPPSWAKASFPHPIDSLPPTSFLTLQVLEITISSNVVVGMPAWDLPSLRYLSISGLSVADIAPLLPLITTNGPRLLGMGVWTTNRTECILHRVLVHTTALRSLVFNDIDLASFRPPSSSAFPSITHIGLSTIVYSRLTDIVRIWRALAFILPRKIFPNLSVIRILTESNSNTLSQDWEETIVTTAQHGIRLEDLERRLLRCEVQATEH